MKRDAGPVFQTDINRLDYHQCLEMKAILDANLGLIFVLQLEKALGTETSIVQFGNILHFVNAQLNHAALAFGIRIGLALNSGSASFAGNDFVFGPSQPSQRKGVAL